MSETDAFRQATEPKALGHDCGHEDAERLPDDEAEDDSPGDRAARGPLDAVTAEVDACVREREQWNDRQTRPGMQAAPRVAR